MRARRAHTRPPMRAPAVQCLTPPALPLLLQQLQTAGQGNTHHRSPVVGTSSFQAVTHSDTCCCNLLEHMLLQRGTTSGSQTRQLCGKGGCAAASDFTRAVPASTYWGPGSDPIKNTMTPATPTDCTLLYVESTHQSHLGACCQAA
jgi:hypothetical protein